MQQLSHLGLCSLSPSTCLNGIPSRFSNLSNLFSESSVAFIFVVAWDSHFFSVAFLSSLIFFILPVYMLRLFLALDYLKILPVIISKFTVVKLRTPYPQTG